MKKLLIIVAVVLALGAGTTGQAAELEAGTYMVANETHYVNPDSGKADDGGDTSIGEAMCRNVTYDHSLYELKDGKHYVTIRLKMISFISSVEFNVQTKQGDAKAYEAATYTVTGENKEENTKDFRFEIGASDLYINPVLFVEPMNRSVTYYISLDTAKAEADQGVFAAYNGEKETPAEAAVPQQAVSEEQMKVAEEGKAKPPALLPAEVKAAITEKQPPKPELTEPKPALQTEPVLQKQLPPAPPSKADVETSPSTEETQADQPLEKIEEEEVDGIIEFQAQEEQRQQPEKSKASYAMPLIILAGVAALGAVAYVLIQKKHK